MTDAETIILLEQKNKALSDQLDKITNDLFTMQDAAAELKNQLESKKHTEQLGGWAIDRALETSKLAGAGITGVDSVIEAAKKYCAWIKQAEPDAVPPTIQ